MKKHLIRALNNTRLWKKLVIAYLILVLIPMLVLYSWFQIQFVGKLEQRTLDMQKVIVQQVAGSIEDYMNQIIGVSDSVARSEQMISMLSASETRMKRMLHAEKTRDDMMSYLENLSGQRKGAVSSIRIYCEPDHPLLALSDFSKYGLFESIDQINTSLWYGNLHFQQETSCAASIFYMNSWETEGESRVAYIRKIIYYVDGEAKEAYAAVYFDQNYLTKALAGYGDYPNSCIYLVDKKECSLATSGVGEYGSMMMYYSDMEDLIGEPDTFVKIDFGNRKAWAMYTKIGNLDWRLAFCVPVDSITSDAQNNAYLFLGIYALTALLLCIPVLGIATSITGRVNRLKNQMQKVRKEIPEPLEGEAGKDEIGVLTDSYNYMVEEIKTLMEEQLQAQKDAGRMEMSLLRSQINPHFLYNTLDVISWYAVKGETKDVTETIQTLAKFYRLSLNRGKMTTTLEKEVQLVGLYISIQQRRVGCSIDFVADLPDLMLEQEVPQFLLQPLVENALKHGIMEKPDCSGTISVLGWIEGDEMVVMVADDGVGMDEETLAEILDSSSDHHEEGHVAVKNVYRRLQLYYGEDHFSMKYTSQIGEGTQVELRLPMPEESGEEDHETDGKA